ncbi:MAG TPA: PEP/pyruvate-binding domain-containing protein, partial [Kofleriaceae bacterium]
IGELRDRNKALMGRVAQRRAALLERATRMTSVPRAELSRYLLAELDDLLTANARVASATVARRWELVVLRRHEQLYDGDTAHELAAMSAPMTALSEDGTLTGTCASEGVVSGIVKHVRSGSDARQVGEHHVMVAVGTDFDMMDGLRTCKGIITEEGGLLSHASVIARELAKPCLIGVGRALSLLPDGSEVELDATGARVRLRRVTSPTRSRGRRTVALAAATDPATFGPKAARLAQVKALGYPVMPGVVVPAGVRPDEVDRELADEIIATLETEAGHRGPLIVRSSATCEDLANQSAAGVFTSIPTAGDHESLTRAARDVLAAAHTQRVRAYFADPDQVKLALLIQPLLRQTLGGVAFSRDPRSGRLDPVVEASRAGASAVVSGSPQLRAVLARTEVRDATWAPDATTQCVLRYAASVACVLEELLAMPVDLEWGCSKDSFYVFQVRPITTVRYHQEPDTAAS